MAFPSWSLGTRGIRLRQGYGVPADGGQVFLQQGRGVPFVKGMRTFFRGPATAGKLRSEYAGAGARRIGGNAARVAGASAGSASDQVRNQNGKRGQLVSISM